MDKKSGAVVLAAHTRFYLAQILAQKKKTDRSRPLLVDKFVNRMFLLCILSAVSGIPLMIVFSIIIYFIYGCWPLGNNLGNCLGSAPLWVIFIPIVLVCIIGFVWSGKTKIKIPDL